MIFQVADKSAKCDEYAEKLWKIIKKLRKVAYLVGLINLVFLNSNFKILNYKIKKFRDRIHHYITKQGELSGATIQKNNTCI